MAQRVVVRRKQAPKKKFDPAEVVETFRVWAREKEAEANAKSVKERIRTDSLFPMIEALGSEDDKGSLVLLFDKPVPVTSVNADGVRKSVTYVGVKKERRASPKFLEDVATEWLKANRLLNKVQVLVKTIVKRPGEEEEVTLSDYLDQDAIYVLNQEGKIDDATLDSFFEDEITWALVPVKA